MSQVFDIEDESHEVVEFSHVAARRVPVGTERYVGSVIKSHLLNAGRLAIAESDAEEVELGLSSGPMLTKEEIN